MLDSCGYNYLVKFSVSVGRALRCAPLFNVETLTLAAACAPLCKTGSSTSNRIDGVQVSSNWPARTAHMKASSAATASDRLARIRNKIILMLQRPFGRFVAVARSLRLAAQRV